MRRWFCQLAIPQIYTYSVPTEFHDLIQPGIRVEAPLRNKLYSGVVFKIESLETGRKVRPILSLIDESPIIGLKQMKFWQWIAEYYCCTMGEVMNVALPAGTEIIQRNQNLPQSLSRSSEISWTFCQRIYSVRGFRQQGLYEYSRDPKTPESKNGLSHN